MKNNELLNALYPILRNDLQAFSERCFYELHPADSYADSWAIRSVCYKIEQCIAGKILRLIICVPPRSLKSHIASVCLPAYLLGRDPTTKIISASYGHDLADKFANETRTLMKTPFYRDLFPSTIISATKDTQSEYDTTEHGGRRATSVEGSFTGFGGDYLIFDDLMKSADASSDAARKRVIDWFETTALTRLNNPKEGRIIIVNAAPACLRFAGPPHRERRLGGPDNSSDCGGRSRISDRRQQVLSIQARRIDASGTPWPYGVGQPKTLVGQRWIFRSVPARAHSTRRRPN